MALKLSDETENKVQKLLEASTSLVWTMVLRNVFELAGYGLLIWLLFRLYIQLQAFI